MSQLPIKKRAYRTYYTDAIRTIFERIIKPTLSKLSYMEHERALDEGIRRFFHTDTRSVYFAKATADFTIPGKEWISLVTNYLRWGAGSPRKVLAGMNLIVRFDDNPSTPKVDIEFGDAVFTMTVEAYDRIRTRVELIA